MNRIQEKYICVTYTIFETCVRLLVTHCVCVRASFRFFSLHLVSSPGEVYYSQISGQRVQIHISKDTTQIPHILVLQIETIAVPNHHDVQDILLTFMQCVFGHVELGRQA